MELDWMTTASIIMCGISVILGIITAITRR